MRSGGATVTATARESEIPVPGWKRARGSSRTGWRFACGGQLQVISPVQGRENVSARFAFAKKIEVELTGVELIVEAVKAPEMVFGSLRRVLRRAFGFDEEGPVTRLGEEKLAGSLSKQALDQGSVVSLAARDFCHAAGGGVQVRINPSVVFLQPNTVEAVLAPTGRIWPNDLLRRMRRPEIRSAWRAENPSGSRAARRRKLSRKRGPSNHQ